VTFRAPRRLWRGGGTAPRSAIVTDGAPPTDRFNEEKSAYTVRGSDQPDLDTGVAAIRKTVKTLPVRPGVYRMLDAKGDVLYVGKARALRNRVTNYTQVSRLSKRLQRMVAQTRSMQIVTTNTEAEALLLEAQLIKRYRPPYNVLLRDDKSFPFIRCARTIPFPRCASIAARGGTRGNITGRSPAPGRSPGR
jgi:excinuclease ABC subunit C